MHTRLPDSTIIFIIRHSCFDLFFVIEYLVKKGYNRTEQMLRSESSRLDKDGRPIQDRVEDLGHLKYRRAFQMLLSWIESNLDIYKVWFA